MNPTSPSERRRERPESGFTLVEIMVVVVILGILVTLFARNVFDIFGDSQIGLAETKVKLLDESVGTYKVKNGRMPKSLEELTEPNERGLQIERELPKDPWGNDYELRKGDKASEWAVISAGPDGTFDTDDDISSKKKEK